MYRTPEVDDLPDPPVNRNDPESPEYSPRKFSRYSGVVFDRDSGREFKRLGTRTG